MRRNWGHYFIHGKKHPSCTQNRAVLTHHRTPDAPRWRSRLALGVGEGQKQTRCIDSPVRRRDGVKCSEHAYIWRTLSYVDIACFYKMEDIVLLEDIVLWVYIVYKNEKRYFDAKDKCVMLSDVRTVDVLVQLYYIYSSCNVWTVQCLCPENSKI
jgi:hypothetical protein